MYRVTLIHLSPDAGSTGAESRVDHGKMSGGELREMLVNFCAIDEVEHATIEPEIRVQVRDESYVLRAGHKNLVLYDVLDRAAPGQVVSVDEAMAELDGTARAARTALPWQKLQAEARAAVPVVVPVSPRAVLGRRIALGVAALVLIAAAAFAHWWWEPDVAELAGSAIPPEEMTAVQDSVAGVYLTGNEPGDHGLVIMPTGELRLFEFRGTEAPRVVHARYQPVRAGPALALVTDQPGGVALVRNADTLVYCGETYVRVR